MRRSLLFYTRKLAADNDDPTLCVKLGAQTLNGVHWKTINLRMIFVWQLLAWFFEHIIYNLVINLLGHSGQDLDDN